VRAVTAGKPAARAYPAGPMPSPRPVAALARVATAFGPAAAREKLRLLTEIEGTRRLSLRDLRAVHDVVCFLRAYPDDARVLAAVLAVVARLRDWLGSARAGGDREALAETGFPGSVVRGELGLSLLARMARRLPAALEIDWDELEAPGEEALANLLGLLVTSGECQGLDDIGIPLREWFAACRPDGSASDLSFLMRLLADSALDDAARDLLFECCAVPLRYALDAPGTGRCELAWPVERVHYQRAELDRTLLPPAAVMRRAFPDSGRVSPARGEQLIHLAQLALCARGLEIRTLSHANGRDVSLFTCGRGLGLVLIGVVPGYRDPLESHYVFLALKNGVPIGYGPSSVSLGTCELGLNLFPEFRGAEIRYIYPQLMRVLHQALGVEYFFLTPYGMGLDNPAAIRTGAFWFYRKLGFRPSNPAVEELARAEEERLRREPGRRSSPSMLRRLARTSAYFDVSGGTCHPLELGPIGLRQSRLVARAYGGDRRRATRDCVRRLARALGLERVPRLSAGERRAWEMLAPLLVRIPGLAAEPGERSGGDTPWSARDRRRLRRILRAKGAPSERDVDRLIRGHELLCAGLRLL